MEGTAYVNSRTRARIGAGELMRRRAAACSPPRPAIVYNGSGKAPAHGPTRAKEGLSGRPILWFLLFSQKVTCFLLTRRRGGEYLIEIACGVIVAA